jgi:hypothetical protein
MKIFLLLLGAVAAIITLVAIVGSFLPRAHVATRSAAYAKSPAELYAIARDFAAAPTWRSGVKSTELLPPREGRVCYRETSRHGAITYVVLEDRPGEKLVTEIADRDLPFGGTWTFAFAPAGQGGGSVRITERGEVKNVIFRFLARFAFGHTRTMEDYLRDLGRKLGEQTEPKP